jgi:hypothetical protein
MLDHAERNVGRQRSIRERESAQVHHGEGSTGVLAAVSLQGGETEVTAHHLIAPLTKVENVLPQPAAPFEDQAGRREMGFQVTG